MLLPCSMPIVVEYSCLKYSTARLYSIMRYVRKNFFSGKNLSFCHSLLIRHYNSRTYSRLTKVFIQKESVIICQTAIFASNPSNYQIFSTIDGMVMHKSRVQHTQIFERVRVANMRIWFQKHVKWNYKYGR